MNRDYDRLDTELLGLGRVIRRAADQAPPAVVGRVLAGLADAPGPVRVPPVALAGLTAVLLGLVVPFADFEAGGLFNAFKLCLLLACLAGSSLCLLRPELVARLDRRLLAGVHLRRARAAAGAADLAFFRLQGVYFIIVAFFIARV